MTTRVLLFEPRFEGHHLPWTGMISNALLAEGYEVLFAHGSDPRQLARLDEAFPGLCEQLECVSVQTDGKFNGGSAFSALHRLAERSSPDRILVANLDEFASRLFRGASLWGGYAQPMKMQLRGIYHRPRPLDPAQGGIGNMIKRLGYRRLVGQGAFARLGILDEFLVEQSKGASDTAPMTWMPDFWRPMNLVARDESRTAMQVPDGAMALLFFGVSHRRKGLDLAVAAMERCADERAFLLLAGRQDHDPALASRIGRLVEDGRAVVHDRFLSEDEMSMAFSASDRVLLPYRSHYGSSNILSTAASVLRPVIASDFHLIGKRVIEHRLGVVHKDRDATSLGQAIDRSLAASSDEFSEWVDGMTSWAAKTSPEAFGKSVLELVNS